MNEMETAAELRHLIKHLQAEVKAIEAGSGRPLPPKPISVHAIVRSMARVKGIEMRRLLTEILPHERRGLLKAGPGRINYSGYKLVCSGGVEVTII